MTGLEFIGVYIDDLMYISTDTLDDHLDKLCQVRIRLRDANLKVNAPNSFFCSTKCEYPGYVLIRDEIKPQHKKVEAILTLIPPKSIKGLRCFLGIVQFY